MAGATNQAETLSTALDMQDEVYDLEPIITQARFGSTTQHFKRVEDFVSGQNHVKVYKEQYSGARVTDDLEADAHYSGGIDVADVAIQESDFRRVGFSLSRSIVVSKQMSYDQHATFDLAVELQLEALEAAMEKENFLLNSNADCVKAVVAAVYNEDGTTYTSGQTDAFIKVDQGSISSFHPGETLHIRAASDNADVQVKVIVNDVVHDEYFRNLNIGPGIIVTISAVGPGDSGTDSNLDNVADGDEIVAAGETDDNYPAAFGALCDFTGATAYFGLTRTTKGNAWAVPYGRHYDASGNGTGAATALNIDTHFGNMFKTFGRTLSNARQYRKNRKFQLTDAIVCQANPDLIAEVAKQAGDSSARFTKQIAASMGDARKSLTAVAGWDGVVLHTPYSAMPPILLQEEPLMPSGTIRLFEPSTFVKYCMGGRKPQWIPNAAGGNWHNRRNTSTGNLTVTLDAFGFTINTYFCDQPRLVYQMDGLKDSLS